MFYVYFRKVFYADKTDIVRSTLQGAKDAGLADGRPFDVYTESGTVTWSWLGPCKCSQCTTRRKDAPSVEYTT